MWSSPWGQATFEFAPDVSAALGEHRIRVSGEQPIETLDEGQGLYLPVAFSYDDDAVCYPGGFTFADEDGKSFGVDGALWLTVEPARISAVPVVDGDLGNGRMDLAAFDAAGTIGSSETGEEYPGWALTFSAELASALNGLAGTEFKEGDALAQLVPVRKYLPA